jgi:hypothetical protein
MKSKKAAMYLTYAGILSFIPFVILGNIRFLYLAVAFGIVAIYFHFYSGGTVSFPKTVKLKGPRKNRSKRK